MILPAAVRDLIFDIVCPRTIPPIVYFIMQLFSQHVRRMRWRRALSAFASLILLASVAGCKSGGFQAAELPSEFQAPPTRYSQKLDLSNLARAATQSEVLYPGDTISLTISTGLEEQRVTPQVLRIAEDGTVNVSLIGPVRVAGLTLPQVEQLVYEASVRGGYYRNPQVSLQLTERRTNRVTVMGAVVKPGVYELPPSGSDLLSAITAAGGLSEDADTVVEIRRPHGGGVDVATDSHPGSGPVQASYRGVAKGPGGSMRVDLQNVNIGDGRDYRLHDGAVVMIMKRPDRHVQVMGLVHKPGQFKIPDDQDLRLLDALALAGGRVLNFADDVVVVRQIPEREEAILIRVSVSEAKKNPEENLRLAAGDLISVEETPLTFTFSTLRSVVNFGVGTSVRTF